MKKYPKMQISSVEKNGKHQSTAKTKVPCGIIIMSTIENTDAWYADFDAQRECKYQAELHMHKHQCGP